MTAKLYRSHRTIGWEVSRNTAPDGKEYVVLQTAEHRLDAALAYTLFPVSDADLAMHVRAEIASLIDRARFLGLDAETMHTLFDLELNLERTANV